MELLLTILLYLWQLGWVLVLAGGLCAGAALCIRPLRSKKAATFAACVVLVCALLLTLCAHPVVLGADDSGEREQVQQLAAGWYSRRMLLPPVCAMVREADGERTVQVWYAFVGSMTYVIDGEGLPSIVDWLFPWQ